MVKGISRRVVVVDSPDQRFFEQAIFFVRMEAYWLYLLHAGTRKLPGTLCVS